jgi:hypothetical protein
MWLQLKRIAFPLTIPDADPIPFGPLHEPDILLPTCRKTHTGVVRAFGIMALNVHVPAKFAALATPIIDRKKAHPTRVVV